MVTRNELILKAKELGASGIAFITPPQYNNFEKCIKERKEYRYLGYINYSEFLQEFKPISKQTLMVMVFDFFVTNDYPKGSYKISNRGRYLWQTISVRGKQMINHLEENGYKAKLAVVPERATAAIAGLGVIGKNTLFYAHGVGSYVGIRVIETNFIPEYYDEHKPECSHGDLCHKCGKCIRECPVNAIHSDGYRINPFKCVSFLNRHMSETFRSWPDDTKKLGNWLDGCETCQDVCPMNNIPNRIRNDKLIVEPINLDGIHLDADTYYLTRDEILERRHEITNTNYRRVIDMILDEDDYTPFIPTQSGNNHSDR